MSGRAMRRPYLPHQNPRSVDGMPIIFGVLVGLGGDDRAFEGRSGEQAFGSAVGVDGGGWRYRDFGVASDRAGSDAGVGAQGDVAASGERAHGILIIENKHKIGDLGSDLRAPARAPGSDKGGSRPSMIGPRYHHAFAAFAAKDETRFHYGHDCQSSGVPKNMRGMSCSGICLNSLMMEVQ